MFLEVCIELASELQSQTANTSIPNDHEGVSSDNKVRSWQLLSTDNA